jgi:ATP-dependent Clp protease ATP-binding subunit ClpC
MRHEIEGHTAPREKVSTSVDLPLSRECKRVLAYGAEESERLNHKHIGTDHLLLGCCARRSVFASQLLREQGLILDSVREQVRQSEAPFAQGGSASFARLDQWLAEREAQGSAECLRAICRGSHLENLSDLPIAQTLSSYKKTPPVLFR